MRFIIIYLTTSFGVISADEKCFRAAVYEGPGISDGLECANQEISKNLEVFEYVAKEASTNKAQIIVYPEYGLLPREDRTKTERYGEIITDKIGTVNPCNKPEEFAKQQIQLRLSCAAKKNHIFIVAHLAEVEYCDSKKKSSDCPADGRYQYNTAIAFNSEGFIVAKYRKNHLFGESDCFDWPKKQEYSTFDTPFGRIGLLICFDSLFKQPAFGLINEKQVTTLAMPTWWINEYPFLVAHQFQQSFAIAQNINYLAANGNDKSLATTGSGIYNGIRGAAIYKYKSKAQVGTLLISTISVNASDISASCEQNSRDIPIEIQKTSSKSSSALSPSGDEYHLYYNNLDKLNKIKLNERTGEVNICKDKVCCQLSYSTNDATFKRKNSYFVGVGHGIRVMQQGHWCEEMCLVYAFNETNNAFALSDSTEFDRIKLSGTFTAETIYPSLVSDDLKLVPTCQWNYKPSDNKCLIESTSKIKLISASLYGRCFQRDPPLHRLAQT
ncbi:pantetheinase-like isoform X1 [Leptotrombidium deliense]|uniref:Pantetheinase-like isoform X1 n=1 Tax=Leptotrombidium deliense TaxID=299467 RepID=A0A443SEU6_9ACAR|nr:pantetheinase-like isoform X1 [Leptotrombidium deliense]